VTNLSGNSAGSGQKQDMNNIPEEELQALNGGVLWIFTALGGALIGAAVSGWPDFKQGYSDAYWHQQNLANK
jgi:hypothetical protein